MKVVASDDYVKCDSGLVYLDIEVGKGDCPKAGQQVFTFIFFRNYSFFYWKKIMGFHYVASRNEFLCPNDNVKCVCPIY